MAYFGGTTTERPWPKVDYLALLLLLIFVSSIGAFLYFGTDLFRNHQLVAASSQGQMNVAKPVVAEVLVASETIWPGQRILPAMLKLETRSLDSSAEVNTIKSFEEIRGGFAATTIVPEIPLLKQHVTYQQPANILTARIPEGFRAVAIPVDAESGVEGWARPGARVDVVWTSKVRGKMMVSTIVENAQVLSAERSVETVPGNASTSGPMPQHITLMVSIKDAQKIQLAKTSGSMSLNLRGDGDADRAGSGTLTVDNLLRRRDKEALNEVQGSVKMGGKDFVMQGGKLIPAENVKEVE